MPGRSTDGDEQHRLEGEAESDDGVERETGTEPRGDGVSEPRRDRESDVDGESHRVRDGVEQLWEPSGLREKPDAEEERGP